MGVLIDREGEIWQSDSRALRANYGAACSNAAFERFLVRNLGFISVRVDDRSCAIKASPSRLSFKSFATLSDLLSKENTDRVSVSLFDHDWQHLILPSLNAALGSLLQSASGNAESKNRRFRSRSRPIESLSADNPLMALFEIWKQNSGYLDLESYPQIINEQLDKRFVLVERKPDASQLVFSRIGEGFAMYDKEWTTRLVGYPVEYQPDVHYAKWIANFWRSALISGKPTLNDVDANIINPLQRTKRRVKYSRLTLPVSEMNGATRLLSASLVDPHLDPCVKVN
ncbi:MAG: hypothetical protein ACR2PI_08710 [Hyphomicrobiaceae bacterium]